MIPAEERCKEWVHSDERWDFRGHQCTRRKIDGDYCRLHAEKNDKPFQARVRAHAAELERAASEESTHRRLAYFYEEVIAHLQSLGRAQLAESVGCVRHTVLLEQNACEERRKAIAANVPKRNPAA